MLDSASRIGNLFGMFRTGSTNHTHHVAKKNPAGRTDRRYKDTDNAPKIVSEKRFTFFLGDAVFKELKLMAAHCTVAESDFDTPAGLPETPSAVIREAIAYWLDQFRRRSECERTDAEWEAFFEQLEDATKV